MSMTEQYLKQCGEHGEPPVHAHLLYYRGSDRAAEGAYDEALELFLASLDATMARIYSSGMTTLDGAHMEMAIKGIRKVTGKT